MRLITDQFAFAAEHVPRWNTISISGYHIREAGSTALQELAFTLRDGMEYVSTASTPGCRRRLRAAAVLLLQQPQRLLRGDRQVPRRAQDLGPVMRERYGAEDPRSWMLRFHTQTAGCSLTAQQPINNVVRTTRPGARRGARRHPVAAHQRARRDARAAHRGQRRGRAADAADPGPRVGRDHTVDPLGGSYFVEEMTRRMVDGAFDYFRRSTRRRHGRGDRGRLPAARDHGRRLTTSRRSRSGEKLIVGVNSFQVETTSRSSALYIDDLGRQQMELPRSGSRTGATPARWGARSTPSSAAPPATRTPCR
jgi:methylmalonyl-CoA mutase, N-terminal domain